MPHSMYGVSTLIDDSHHGHAVIIKGTNCWRGGSKGYQKTSKSDIIQSEPADRQTDSPIGTHSCDYTTSLSLSAVLGRAGRPGFDTSGVAVIMTSQEDRQLYSDLSLHADTVESSLQGGLVEGDD